MKRWLSRLFAAVPSAIALAVSAAANRGGSFHLMWTQEATIAEIRAAPETKELSCRGQYRRNRSDFARKSVLQSVQIRHRGLPRFSRTGGAGQDPRRDPRLEEVSPVDREANAAALMSRQPSTGVCQRARGRCRAPREPTPDTPSSRLILGFLPGQQPSCLYRFSSRTGALRPLFVQPDVF